MPPFRKRKTPSPEARGIAEGYRSGLEDDVAAQLIRAGIEPNYEATTIHYTKPPKPPKKGQYTPDFILPNGIIIETKGRFITADRQRHLLIKQQLPDLDIRFVFSRPKDKIGKKSKTTYAKWCDKKGFKWAEQRIPQEWIDENTGDR